MSEKCVHGRHYSEHCHECRIATYASGEKVPEHTVKVTLTGEDFDRFEQPTNPKAPLEKEIRAKCQELADFLVGKNAAYGNSAADPINIFAKGLDPLQNIDIRIDDKLNRLSKGSEYLGDDTVKDLTGYLILRMIIADQAGALI